MSEQKIPVAASDNRFERFFAAAGRRTIVAIIGIFLFVTLAVAELAAEVVVLAYWRFYKAAPAERVADVGRHLLVLGSLIELGVPPPGAPGVRYVGNIKFPSTNRHWLPSDPVLGWRHGAAVGVTDDIATTNDTAYYATTPQGFRSLDGSATIYALPKPDDVFRIVVMGGSTVAGDSALGPADSMPAALAKLVDDAVPGRRVEVINAGVSGYNSSQELLYLLTELGRYQPDLVVVYDGLNDVGLTNAQFTAEGSDANPFRNREVRDHDARIKASYSLAGGAVSLYGAALGGVAAILERSGLQMAGKLIAMKLNLSLTSPSVADQWQINARTVEVYKENHAVMAALARLRGFRLALFLQPVMGIDGKPYTDEERRIFEAVMTGPALEMRRQLFEGLASSLREMAFENRDHPALCIADIRDVFAGVKDRLYVDTIHVTGAGNARVAARIKRELKGCGLL